VSSGAFGKGGRPDFRVLEGAIAANFVCPVREVIPKSLVSKLPLGKARAATGSTNPRNLQTIETNVGRFPAGDGEGGRSNKPRILT